MLIQIYMHAWACLCNCLIHARMCSHTCIAWTSSSHHGNSEKSTTFKWRHVACERQELHKHKTGCLLTRRWLRLHIQWVLAFFASINCFDFDPGLTWLGAFVIQVQFDIWHLHWAQSLWKFHYGSLSQVIDVSCFFKFDFAFSTFAAIFMTEAHPDRLQCTTCMETTKNIQDYMCAHKNETFPSKASTLHVTQTMKNSAVL